MRAIALGLLLARFALPGTAQSMEIVPGVSAGVVYTDNVRLESEGNEESEIATELIPSLVLDHDRGRVNFQLDGQLQFIFYQDSSDSNAIFADGSTSLDLELIKEHLFLDSFGSISQTPVDPSEPLTNTNIPITTNRTDQIVLETNPRWQSVLLGNQLQISYAFGKVNYDDESLQDSLYHRITSSYGSGIVEQGFGWSIDHNYASFEYDLPPKAKYQTLSGNGYYAFGNGFSLTGMYGRESDFLDFSSSELTENMWSVGFSYVTDSLELTANSGERSYGDTLFLRFKWELTNNGFVQVTYSETPETTESISQQRQKPTDQEIPDIPPIIDTPGSGNVFISERLQGTFRQDFSRNSITITAFSDKQTNFVTQDGSPPPGDNDAIGFIADWTYEIGNRTDLVTLGSWTTRDVFTSELETVNADIYVLQVSVIYRVGSKTNIDAWAQHVTDTGVQANEYNSNSIGISLNRTF